MKWSWLQNPAVALVELLASVIAVVQSVAWLCRCIYHLQTEAENERYRSLRIAFALAALAVVIAASAITWPVIIAEAAKGGDHGFMGVMYPLEFAFLGLFAAQTLLQEARAQQRFSPSACCVLAVTLATVATAYFFFRSGPVGWIGYGAAWSAPNLAIVAGLYMFLRYLRQVRPKQANE